MKGRLPSRNNLKIISATSVVIFTLLTVFVGTYSWFLSFRDVQNSGNDLKVEKVNGSVDGYSIHEYYGVTGDSTTWGFNPEAFATVTFGQTPESSSTFTMGEYSLDNPDHPVLILFSVSGSYETITANTTSVYLASNEATLKQSDNPLSSVIESQSLTFASDPKANGKVTGNLVNEDGQTQSYTYMPVVKDDLSSKSSFIGFNNNVPDYKTSTKFFEGDITGKAYIGIVINYNSESLNYISSYYLGHTYLTNGLEFSCDWSLEV